MKNISTFQIIIIGIFIFAAIFGMFIFATSSSGGSKDKQAVGKVVIWGTLPQTSVRTALNAISQEDPKLKGVSYVGKQPATFAHTLTAAIASGKGPDLILLSQEDLNALASTLSPISYNIISKRSFLNTFANASTIYLGANSMYGIPIGIDPLMLYYNRPMFSSASIAAPPTTWEALTGLVPLITKTTSSQNITKALIAFGSYDNVHDAGGILSTLFLQAGLPIVSSGIDGRYKVSLGEAQTTQDASSIPAGESIVRFYASFSNPNQVSYTWNSTMPNSQQFFLSGNAALYLGYASEYNFLSKANPNLLFDIAPIPQLQTVSTKTVYAKVYALSIPNGSSNPRGALLAASLLSNPGADSIFAQVTGLAPSLRSLLATAPNNSISAVVYPAAIMATTWLSPSLVVTNQIFSRMIQDIVTGRVPIAQALTNAEQSIRASLQ